jgi:hypothetical protein
MSLNIRSIPTQVPLFYTNEIEPVLFLVIGTILTILDKEFDEFGQKCDFDHFSRCETVTAERRPFCAHSAG